MDKDAALKWLTWLYGETFDGHVWIGGHLDGFGGRLFTAGALDAAVDYAALLDEGGADLEMAGVYHRLTTMREVLSGRGKATDSITLPALMMDLDIRGPGHKAENYPESFDALCSLLADAGVPEPSTWVSSGGGWYPVWKLTEAAPVHDADVLAVMQERSRGLHRAVIAAGKALGLKVDNTSDLARVYRLPGTTNRKPGVRPVIATWGGESGRTYKAAQLDVKPVQRAAEAEIPRGIVDSSTNSSSSLDLRGGMAGLFGQGASHAADDVRAFTVTQAMDFVRPALDALRAAQDGEINVRLNDAACALAHFGAEFWGEDAADRQLYAALSATVYDGVTWRAEDTIASARRAMAGSWRGLLVPEVRTAETMLAAPAPADAVEALLAEMVSVGELARRPTPKFLVHGLLQMDSESWLIGAPGSKKSFVAFDIAARVSRGEAWQGRRTNAADVVLIVAEGAGGAGKRGRAWEQEYGVIEEGAVRVLPRPVQAADVTAWRILTEACGRLADSARERGRGVLIVLDTQARVTVGLDENSATEMGRYVEAVRMIRERTGGCVLSVHHTGRAGKDARGSSAIDGAQTTELKVESASGALTAKLTTEKQKDMEPASPIDLRFKSVYLGRDEDGEAITSLVLLEPSAWSEAEVNAEELDGKARESQDPFGERMNLEPWIVRQVPNASLQWWIIQALVDTTEELGLLEAGVKEIVVAKRGKQDPSTWRKAWQKVTSGTGQWADVVVNAGGSRWAVDHLAVASKRSEG